MGMMQSIEQYERVVRVGQVLRALEDIVRGCMLSHRSEDALLPSGYQKILELRSEHDMRVGTIASRSWSLIE